MRVFSVKAVASAANFCNVNNNGNCNYNNASNAGGVRPDFTTAHYRAKFPRAALRKEELSIRTKGPINAGHDGAGYDHCVYSRDFNVTWKRTLFMTRM